MEWFNQKTSIAGTQVPNWLIVLGAVIIVLVIYILMRH
jgi:type VI protein secretion system component VasF